MTDLTSILDEIVDQVGMQTAQHPVGFAADADGQLLGIALLESKMCDLWDEWRNARHRLPAADAACALEARLVDVAAITVMMIYGLHEAHPRM